MAQQPGSMPLLIATPSGYQFAQGIERHLTEKYLPKRWGTSGFDPKQNDLWVPSKIIRFGDSDFVAGLDRHIRDEKVYVIADVYSHAVPLPKFPEGEELGYVATMLRDRITVQKDATYFNQPPHKFTVSENFDMLLAMLNATRNAVKGGKVTVVLPCFPSARQDRRGGRRSLDMKRRIEELEDYVDEILTVDLHNPGAGENAVSSRVGLDQLSATQSFIEYLLAHNEEYDPSLMRIVSPDHGAKERNKKFAQHFQKPFGIYDKDRDQTRPNVLILAEDLPLLGLGKEDISKMVCYSDDDMIDTAGTTTTSAESLRKKGDTLGTVVLSTHPILSHPARRRLQEAYDQGFIRKVIVTNSVTLRLEDYHLPYLAVVDISKLVAKAIDALTVGESISALIEQPL